MVSVTPGVKIQTRSDALATDTAEGININSIILVTALQAPGATANTPVKVANEAALTPLGAISDIGLRSYKQIRAIAPAAEIWVVPANSDSADDLETAITGLSNYTVLPLSVVVCPDGYVSTVPADRQKVANALETFCTTPQWDFLAFVNAPPSVVTKADADAEFASVTSPRGHLSAYFGYQLIEAEQVPMAVLAAAWLIQINAVNTNGLYPPAQNGIELPGTLPSEFLLPLADAEEALNDGRYNYPWPSAGKTTLHNDSTLATAESGLTHINSRVALSVTLSEISQGLTAEQFKPSDPNPNAEGDGTATLQTQATTLAVLDGLKSRGVLVDYSIDRVAVNGDTTNVDISVKPVSSTRFITVNITNS